MKKIILIALLISLSVNISACTTAEINPQSISSEPTIIEEELSIPEIVIVEPEIVIIEPEIVIIEPEIIIAEPIVMHEIFPVEPVLNEPLSIEFDPTAMPVPFPPSDGAGDMNMMRFTMLGTSCLLDSKLDAIPHFVRKEFNIVGDNYSEWVGNPDLMVWLGGKPATSLMDYINFFSFCVNFNIPADRLREVMKDVQLMFTEREIEDGRDRSYAYFTDEEIEIFTSFNEARILEYFISDYSIFHDGRGFTPAWIYWHSAEDYKAVGITPEMLEERLELYSEFNFTLEATLAFEEKLSEFMGVDVVLDTAARSEQLTINS
jgi:hypothetical protein